jgi:Bacterial protein of unknown function (DUF937)
MSLLDAISGAIANPNQQGSSDQLGSILNMVGSIANSQQGSTSSSDLMSAVGSVVRPALQNHQNTAGSEGVENLVNQFAGTEPSTDAVQAVFGGQAQQAVSTIAERTGMDPNQIGAMLPTVLPLVLQLLQSGASNGGSGGNPVLNTFLDSNHDGSVDLGDLMSQAGRFLH